MYKNYIKRAIDIITSFCGIIILSPIFLILSLIGAIAMRGNPFFSQRRPGYNEKIFNLVKFRTMSNDRDEKGILLSNEKRLNRYGKFLRTTSLDELPELFNILKGDMSIIGPRPLLPEYLPYYTEIERHRHDVRPGLTGLAQVNGRNAIDSWEERFSYDLEYIDKVSLLLDIKIILRTITKVIKREDIVSGKTTKAVGRLDEERAKNQKLKLPTPERCIEP